MLVVGGIRGGGTCNVRHGLVFVGVSVVVVVVVVVTVNGTEKVVRVLNVVVGSRFGLVVGGKELEVRGVGVVVWVGVMVGVLLLLLLLGVRGSVGWVVL